MTEMPCWQARTDARSAAFGLRIVAMTQLAVLIAVATACSNGKPAPDAASDRTPQEASVRVSDVVMRASVVPTEALGDAVAAQYGIGRDSGTVMLLVGVRRGSGANEQALPARITASATDLLGKRQTIAMREVRAGDFIDYAGTAAMIAPDTLRIDIEARVDGTAPLSLQFNRDFFPR